MKKLSALATLVFALFAMNSCGELPVDPPIDQPKGTLKIGLDANISGYTRATDTVFEAGDAIGLYVLTPAAYIDNGKFTLTNGEWTPAETYYWYDTDSLTSTVVGYYPYKADQNFAQGTISFTVNADQSTHALYTASDLMLAATTAVPTENKISLPFAHVLSKVIVSIDNQTDEEIAEVYFANVYGAATVNLLDGSAEYVGSKGSIKAAAATLATGANVWTLILVPQTAKPQLIVTTASQKQYTFDLDEEVVFAPSKQCNAAITISAESKATGFTTTITDWTSDNDLNFHQEEVPEWESIGTGKLVESAIVNLFGIASIEQDIEIEENIATPGRYRLVNPYAEVGGEQPHYMIINTTTGNPYIEKSDTGLDIDIYGDLYVCSACIENNYKATYYGYNIADGVIRFDSAAALVSCSAGLFDYDSNMIIVTLPGYTRPAMYGFDDLIYTGFDVDENGATIAMFNLKSRVDNKFVNVAVFDGVVYSNEIAGKVNEMVAGTIESQDAGIAGHGTFVLRVPIAATGVYTAIVYTTDNEGNPYYFYRQFGHTAPNDNIPECDLTMGDVTTFDAHPEQLGCNIKCSDALSVWTVAIESSIVEADSLLQKNLYDFVTNNGLNCSYNTVRQELGSDNGFNAVFAGLKPETDYTLFVYVKTLYNIEKVAYKTGRTGAEIEWTTLEGKGMFHDITQFFGGWNNYRYNEVEIQQAANGAERYRVMHPYANYWTNATDLTKYAGDSAEYIEFFVAQTTEEYTYLYFSPFRTGYIDTYTDGEYRELIATYNAPYATDLSKYATARYNIKKAEGVYQLAPWYALEGTNMGYPYYQGDEVIIITLPGYTYEFEIDKEVAEAPALAPAKRTIETVSKFERNSAVKFGRPTSKRVAAEISIVENTL